MKMIEVLYEHITEDDTCRDSEEFTNLTQEINEFLDIIPLDRKKIIQLDLLINKSQVTAERQGFEIGFKYAMALKKECGLK